MDAAVYQAKSRYDVTSRGEALVVPHMETELQEVREEERREKREREERGEGRERGERLKSGQGGREQRRHQDWASPSIAFAPALNRSFPRGVGRVRS